MSEPQTNETIMYRLGVLEMSVGTLSEKLDTLTKPLIELCTQQRFQIDEAEKRERAQTEKIEVLESRVAELERAVAYNRGVGKGLMLAVGAIGGLVGSIVSFLIERVFK